MYKDEATDLVVMIMDLLDKSLGEYLDDVDRGNVDSSLLTRLRVFTNVGKALVTIIKKYSHCDLKPDNVMLKKVSPEQSFFLKNQGLMQLPLYPNEYYQVKLIDFGMAAEGSENSRKCLGGTSQYLWSSSRTAGPRRSTCTRSVS